ncbi:hypothetical protein TrLO_g11334 [Triparma laevis f. longispina]|uniref:Uncharacterized protein n=1 Tax=Triparma laevis f. longispina TaxID=1714387 RepID=A0A9W7C0B9_9STRA|nr:hypothetical protein TrLO_g11334 [Triparma laevis f. longispina]
MDTASEYNRKMVLNYRDDQDHLKAAALRDHPDIYAGWGRKKTKGRVDDDKLKRRRGSTSVRELLGGVEVR